MRLSFATIPWTTKMMESRESSAVKPRELAMNTVLAPSPYMTLTCITDLSMPHATASAERTREIFSVGSTRFGSVSMRTTETGERLSREMTPEKDPDLTADATVSARSSREDASLVYAKADRSPTTTRRAKPDSSVIMNFSIRCASQMMEVPLRCSMYSSAKSPPLARARFRSRSQSMSCLVISMTSPPWTPRAGCHVP